MPKSSEDSYINPEYFARASKSVNITNYLQDYPRPEFSNPSAQLDVKKPLPFDSIKENGKGIPFNFILPVANSFVSNSGKVVTEPTIGFGVSTPLPIKYTGAFAIVSNNTKDAATFVAGLGAILFTVEKGDFQANLGVSAEVVCVEHGNRDKIAPNPHIGTCGLFGSIYSSIKHLPSGFGGQIIATPATSARQDNVLTFGLFRSFR